MNADSTSIIAAALLAACAALVDTADAQTFSDCDWISLSGESELGAVVYSTALDQDGNLYAGGNFSSINGVEANRIAMWNGREWLPLGLGLGEIPAPVIPHVQAIATSGTNVFAGGTFITAGGQEAWHLAKWDGFEWSGFGRVVDNVSALFADGDDLYVAAGFNFGNGPTGSTLYRWDGNSWHRVGADDEFKGGILSMVKMNGDLFVAGSSIRVNNVDVGNSARGDGVSWSSLGAGTDNRVNALAVSGTNLYVGGWFDRAGGTAAENYMYHITRWDGSKWNRLRTQSEIGLGTHVYSLAVHGTDLYVGGTFATVSGVTVNAITKWNGTGWSALGSGLNNVPFTMLVDGDKLYVGGQFTTAGGKVSPNIALAHLNGLPPVEILPFDRGVRVFFCGLDPGDYFIQRRSSLDEAEEWETLGTRTADASGAINFIEDNHLMPEAYYQAASVPQ
jgi:hypothetical protein